MPRPPSTALSQSLRLALLPAGLSMAALAAGCAQQQERAGYYDPPPASTITDAQSQFQDARGRSLVRAPSQLQIALRPPPQQKPGQPQPGTAPAQESVAVSAVETAQAEGGPQPAAIDQVPADPAAPPVVTSSEAARQPEAHPASTLFPQAQTFLGTLPCFQPDMRCTAQRITLTLAPNGRWRARAAYLDTDRQSGSAQTDQGCWRSIAERPPRVILLAANGSVRAELAMVANNVLRLRAVNGVSPNLNYSLTRQPDLDPIDELSGRPAPACE